MGRGREGTEKCGEGSARVRPRHEVQGASFWHRMEPRCCCRECEGQGVVGQEVGPGCRGQAAEGQMMGGHSYKGLTLSPRPCQGLAGCFYTHTLVLPNSQVPNSPETDWELHNLLQG